MKEDNKPGARVQSYCSVVHSPPTVQRRVAFHFSLHFLFKSVRLGTVQYARSKQAVNSL